MYRALYLAVLLSLVTTVSASADFRAGAAKVDITPEPGLTSWGYSPPPTMTGTLDPLHAKAVVVQSGDMTAAIVTLDLGRVLLPHLLDEIRVRVAKEGVDHVMFTASHTHQAPPADVDTDYTRKMAQQMGDCILEALKNLKPATIGVGRTTINIASNRRKILENGQCMMVWRNEGQADIGPVDHEAGIIRIDSEDGDAIAVLTNYACHPVVLSSDNTKYSADWVGEMGRVIEEATGAVSLFLQGGSGDINPYLDKTAVKNGGIEAMRSVGRTAGNAVLQALQGIPTVAPETPSVKVSTKRVEVGTRWDVSKKENQATLKQVYGDYMFDKYLSKLPADLSVPISVLMLNENLAFATMPGEPFVQYQLDLKNLSPVENTFMVAYTDEFHIYIPTIKDSAARGYGAAANTYVGVGAGDRMLTELLLDIGRLSGKISDEPTVNDFVLLEGGPEDTLETVGK
jgi:neutral ceramidase